jgi:hypothetical protein
MTGNLITVQEVLESANVNYGAFLIYSEVIEGPRRPLVFFEAVTEDFSLIGATGTNIYIPTATQLTATELTSSVEDTIVNGFVVTNKTISRILVSVTSFIYSAVSMTDILKEDYPNIDWMRLHLHNMGKAVLEQVDADIQAVMAAGYGQYTAVATLDYAGVVDALGKMGNAKWMVDPSNPPYLIISPAEAAALVKDNRFLVTERYYNGVFPDNLEGEKGTYANCRVLVTPLLAGLGRGFIVFPPNFKWGPNVILAWKRKMRVREQRYEDKELTILAASARCNAVVIQANSILRFDISSTP